PVQADWIGSPLTSRLVRTAACCADVPSSVRETDREADEAKAIRDPPRTITDRARTILGLRCERRRLILPPLGRLVPWIGIPFPYKEGEPSRSQRDNCKYLVTRSAGSAQAYPLVRSIRALTL